MGEIKVEWTKNALRNLSKIHNYVALDSPILAQRFLSNLVTKTDRQLSTFPESRRNIPEFENSTLNELKEVIYKGHRIVYDLSDLPTKITVITVLSGRMDLGKHQKNNWILE